VFDNDRQYYSNVVRLPNTANTPKPRIINNLTGSNTISVNSPGNYDYMVYDFNGKTLARGVLVAGINTITAKGMTGGMYMIRFSKDGQQWTEKIVRQ
jgi:hypothetical protein